MICRICYLINKAKTYFIDKKNTSSKNQPLQCIAIPIYGFEIMYYTVNRVWWLYRVIWKRLKLEWGNFLFRLTFVWILTVFTAIKINRALNVETRNGYSRFSFALKKQNMWKISTKYIKFEDIGVWRGQGHGKRTYCQQKLDLVFFF